MCLGVPALVVEILENERAIVDMGGVRKPISTALLDEVAMGDYVIVHVGFALGILDTEEAERLIQQLLREVAVNDRSEIICEAA